MGEFIMMKNINFIVILFSLLIVLSCKSLLHSGSDPILARVGEKYLYLSYLADNIPQNISKTDSIQMMNSLVDNWVRQEVLLQHADFNLPDSLKDFSRQLEIYKNNLIIYEFKKRWVEQRLDTTIEDEEYEEYYQNHLKDFQLKENIVQFAFIKIPIQSEMVEEAKKIFKTVTDTTVNRGMVEEFCQGNAVDYFLDDMQWIPFTELLRRIPIEAYNQEIYLKNNRFIEIKDHPYWYFINLKDFKIKEDVSPLDFEKNRIRSIILNKRKLQLLKKLEDDIYSDATENQQIEIY